MRWVFLGYESAVCAVTLLLAALGTVTGVHLVLPASIAIGLGALVFLISPRDSERVDVALAQRLIRRSSAYGIGASAAAVATAICASLFLTNGFGTHSDMVAAIVSTLAFVLAPAIASGWLVWRSRRASQDTVGFPVIPKPHADAGR